MHRLPHYASALLRGVLSGTLIRTVNRYVTYARLERAVIARYGLTVQAGPFAGMNYITIPPNHALIPKLLGFYEQELHPCIDDVITRGCDVIANVGSAEGYYAIGLARYFPQARVYAYDIETHEQEMCRELARVNRLSDRVSVQGRCDAETLETLIQGKTLILVDCEGCEIDVLDPARAPKLAQADLLIEIHDFDGTTRIADAIKARFAPSHDLTIITSQPRRPEDHPLIAFLLGEDDRRRAVLEREGTQRWFYLRCKMLA